MTTYTAALIGCGRIGAGVERYSAKIQPWAHASVFSQNTQTKLVALVDNDPSKQEKLSMDFPGVPFYTSVTEMMEAHHPDIVSIATLPDTHASIVETVAAYAPKAILCEKPIAHTREAAEKLIGVCKEKNIPLFINHIRRFDPEIRAAKERFAKMGDAMQAHASYTRGIHNNGTHTIDLLRFYLGEIVEVFGQRNTKTEAFTDLAGDINVDGILTFASGVRAAIQSFDASAYSIFDFDFYATRGKVQLRHFGFRVEDIGLKDCSAFVGHKELTDGAPVVRGEVRSFMKPVVQHIVDCLDGKDANVSPGEDGVAALRVIEALEESVRLGSAVKL
jgi:predicted dehydrogenase